MRVVGTRRPPFDAESPGPKDGAERLTIEVIGGIGISYRGEPVRLNSRKARAMLAYLALIDTGRERRDRLAGLFWADYSEQNARSSLRQALAQLREVFVAVGRHPLNIGATEVDLVKDLVELDLTAIERDIAAARAPDILLKRPKMVDAILAGYEDLSPLFNEWIAATRRAAQGRILRALAAAYENEALPRRQRRQMAEAALLQDPLHEPACRAAMRLAAEEGDIGAALRAYARLYEVLADELDMEPSAATQQLVAEIKQGHVELLPPAATSDLGDSLDLSPRPALSIVMSGAPVVAVLPFRTMGPDAAPMHFTEGLVEDTVSQLTALREPVVISSNSTRGFRSQDFDTAAVGRALGAQYVVSGTVRAAGPRVRVAVELSDVTSGAALWANTYDAVNPSPFDFETEIAGGIARTLVPRLREAELQRSRRRRPEDLTAYHLMLQSRDLIFRLERAGFEEAGKLLRRAIDLDPAYAPTYASMAGWYSIRLGQGWSPDAQADTQALERTARTAIGIDGENARALALLGHNRTILSRDYDGALGLFDKALNAMPNDAEALMWSGPTFSFLGDPQEGLRRGERAIALSPQDPFLFRYEHFVAIGHYAAGDYEATVHWGQRSLRGNPHYTSNLRTTAAALVGLGRIEEARPLARKVMELQPGFRVSPLIERQAFRDEKQRRRFGQQLVEAGLPA